MLEMLISFQYTKYDDNLGCCLIGHISNNATGFFCIISFHLHCQIASRLQNHLIWTQQIFPPYFLPPFKILHGKCKGKYILLKRKNILTKNLVCFFAKHEYISIHYNICMYKKKKKVRFILKT